ncbi:MAG: hypothetical protein ACRD1T_00635 [Acidimicrobiia bacterium]
MKRFVPKMRPWQIVLGGVVGLFWLGIGVADLFSIEHVWDLIRSVVLIAIGVWPVRLRPDSVADLEL